MSGFTEFGVHAAHVEKGSSHPSERSLHVAFDEKNLCSLTGHFKHEIVYNLWSFERCWGEHVAETKPSYLIFNILVSELLKSNRSFMSV